MPVYQAVQTDFTKSVDPEWFNHTGVVSGIGTEEIRYSDHAILNLAPEALFYYEFTDDDYTEAPSNIIVDRAWVREWEGHLGEFTLDKTELTGITLDSLVGMVEPEYETTALDHEILSMLSDLSNSQKRKLLETIRIWKE